MGLSVPCSRLGSSRGRQGGRAGWSEASMSKPSKGAGPSGGNNSNNDVKRWVGKQVRRFLSLLHARNARSPRPPRSSSSSWVAARWWAHSRLGAERLPALSVTWRGQGYDTLVNLVLDDAVETLRDPQDPYRLTDETRSLGLVVARGTSGKECPAGLCIER